MIRRISYRLEEPVQEAEVDVLAYFSFPVEHRRQIWSTNSLERLNKEVKSAFR